MLKLPPKGGGFNPPKVGAIKSQAVLPDVDFLDEAISQHCPLCWINNTLENGILNTLTVILAGLCNPAKTSSAAIIFRRHVITDKNKHKILPYFQMNGG